MIIAFVSHLKLKSTYMVLFIIYYKALISNMTTIQPLRRNKHLFYVVQDVLIATYKVHYSFQKKHSFILMILIQRIFIIHVKV